MITDICITIDTEFNIGGAFADPVRRRPIGGPKVTFPVDGRERCWEIIGFAAVFVRPSTRYYVFAASDPLPFLADMGFIAGEAAGRLLERVRGKLA